MGYILPSAIETPADVYLTSNLASFVQEYDIGPIGELSGSPIDVVSSSGDGSVTVPTFTVSGNNGPAFFYDWYFRIHFVPRELDLGNLLSDQTRTLLVWNAFFDPAVVQSFTVSNGDGITVTPPQAAPFSMAALGTYTYEIEVSTQGPPTINAELIFSIDGLIYEVPITGRRVVVWAIPPSWSNAVDEIIEWNTSVQTSFDRTEQRFCLREEPRRFLEYTAQAVGDDTQVVESLLYGWSDRLYGVPIWHEGTSLAADAPAGTSVLNVVSTEYRTFTAGGLLVLRKSSLVYEAVEIDSVTSTTIVLKKPIESSWVKGDRVFPAMVAHLDGQTQMRYVAEDKLEIPVRFAGSPLDTDPRIPDVAAATTYDGIEVYTLGTNWQVATTVDLQADFDKHDNPIGVFQLRARSGWPVIVKSHEWLCKSREEANDLRAFFGRRKGRLTPVWMPTGTADFRLRATAQSGDTGIVVSDNGYGGLVNQHPARQHILIQLRGGTNLVRRITGYEANGDGTAVLTLSESLGVMVTPQSVRRISFLGRYRLATDAVTFSWRTDAVAVVQSSFQLTKPAP